MSPKSPWQKVRRADGLHCSYCNQLVDSGASSCPGCGKELAPPVPAPRTEPTLPKSTGEHSICQAQGRNGKVLLFETHIRIERRGFTAFLSQGMKGDKDILLSSITSIQFKPVGSFTAGYIQFSFMGGQESKRGILQATEDENSVLFTEAQEPEFRKLKCAVEEIIAHPAARPVIAPTYINELEKLAELRSRGIITENEFNAKKKQLLGLGNDG